MPTASTKEFRDRAPVLAHLPGQGATIVIDPGRPRARQVAVRSHRRRRAGARSTTSTGWTWDELHPGGYDPVARIEEQQPRRHRRRGDLPVGRDDALQPSRPRLQEGLLRRVQRVDRRVVLVRRRTACSGLGQTAMRTPEEGVADVERIKALGLRGVMLPGIPAVEDYDSPIYDRCGRRSIDLGLPVVVPHPHRGRREVVARSEHERLPRRDPRQPGHHRHVRARWCLRASPRTAHGVRRGRRRLGAALHVPDGHALSASPQVGARPRDCRSCRPSTSARTCTSRSRTTASRSRPSTCSRSTG